LTSPDFVFTLYYTGMSVFYFKRKLREQESEKSD
jgi:hypothetical protein